MTFMKLIYIGSKLRKNYKMQSALETMAEFFKEFAEVKTASNFTNPVLKLCHSTGLIVSNSRSTDVVLIDVFSTKSIYITLWISLLCKFLSLPYVLVLRGGNLPKRYAKSPKIIDSLFKGASSIVAPSNYLKNFFDFNGFHIEYIPNIIDKGLYEFKKRTPLKPKILYLRGFGEVYNPLMLLKAIQKIKSTLNLEVLMLGSKNDRHYQNVTRYIEQYGLEKIVKIEEKKTREQWISLSKKFSFMISCPDIDNTPTSIIEGAALGLCVISTSVGGVPKLVTENEIFLVSKNDHDELAELLENLFTDSTLYYEKVHLALNWSKKFHWDGVKKSWLKLMHDVIKQDKNG